MGHALHEQICRRLTPWIIETSGKPWLQLRTGKASLKRAKSRAERRKAKADPESMPTYGRYAGYG